VGYVSDSEQRQSHHEDILLIVQGLCNTLQPPPRPFSLFAIADGQSHSMKEETSSAPRVSPPRLAIDTITDVLLPLLSTSVSPPSFTGTLESMAGYKRTLPPRPQVTKQTDEEVLKQWMRNAMRQANQVIYHCNADYDAEMTSTLASMILYKRHLYFANVGDSRAYGYSQKEGLQQISAGEGESLTSTALTLGQQHNIAVEPISH